MSKKETTSEEKNVTKKDNRLFINIFIFIIFFIIGFGFGKFGTDWLLNSKDNEEKVKETEKIDEGPNDITKDAASQDLINNLYTLINGNNMFYSTKGVNISTIDNTSKLVLVYNEIITEQLGTTEELASLWYGSTNCANDFVTDVGENAMVSTNKCTVVRYSKSLFTEINKKLFNDEILDTSVSFTPENGKNCIVDGDTYLCGNVADTSGYTGKLESKFEILKVTKDDEGTIEIYDKGYLVDNRSYVNDPYDQYDNYYLHSTDSINYYYELKSADNLTFKHTFKTDDRQNYYYVSTELVEK